MKIPIFAAVCFGCIAAHADTQLGLYSFNDAQFGSALIESDGGQFSSMHWLNVVNSPPGSPAVLTGVGFDTGVANIGIGNPVVYTIEYAQPILNGPDADLAVVLARFSGDTENGYDLEVSQDTVTFSPAVAFSTVTSINSGVSRAYFYQNLGPYDAMLYVQPVDLSSFGVPVGGTVQAVRITGSLQLDLVRIAGLSTEVIPEPSCVAFAGLGGLIWLLRNRRRVRIDA